jgi:nucleotide-binding universal stress UspA family protein
MRVLLAVDQSESALRAVRYVGSVLHRTPDVTVTIFHVLRPMPRVLLEHGGSENPDMEEALGARLREEQRTWVKLESAAECPILEQACEALVRTGFAKGLVTLKFGREDDIAKTILEEARSGCYETIVVGRTGTSGIKRVFGGGITDHLLHDARGFAVWIIE